MNLKAVFVLDFQDKLTAGLNKITTLFSQLGNLGKKLSLGKLENGADTLDRTATSADGLKRSLMGVVATADRAWTALKRMGEAPVQKVKNALSHQGSIGAVGAAVEGYSVIEPIRQFADFENIARHSAITKGMSGPALEAETRRLMGVFRKEALETGQSSESIAQAYQDLIQTGLKPELAEKLLRPHSRAATAYNITPEALGHAVGALSMNMGIGDEDMAGALASMAQASKEGRFKVEDFSRFLPGITGSMSKLGMTGRGNADLAFAGLETVMKNSSDPSSGATNFKDFLDYIVSPMAAHSFALDSRGMSEPMKNVLKKYNITGVDLPKMLEDAREQGVDPMSAVLGKMQTMTAGLPPEAMAEVIGAFFHNQQARDAVVAMLMHSGDMMSLLKKLNGSSAGTADTDFTSAIAAPKKKLDLLKEGLLQLVYDVGDAFTPIVLVLLHALEMVRDALATLDGVFPGLSSKVLLGVGCFLLFGAAVTAIGMVAPAVAAGFGLMTSMFQLFLVPLQYAWAGVVFLMEALGAVIGVSAGVAAAIVAVALLFAAIAFDIYANWGEFAGFFRALWDGVVDIFMGFLRFLGGFFLGDADMAIAGLKQMWNGLSEFFGALWNIVRQLFSDFSDWVDGWTGGAMTATVGAIKSAWGGLSAWFSDLWASITKPFDDFVASIMNSPVAHLLGLSAAPQLQRPGTAPDGTDMTDPAMASLATTQQVTGSIMVGVDPANGQLRITKTRASAGFGLFPADLDPGLVLGVE